MVLKILVKAFKREVAFLPSKWAIPTILRGLKFFQLHLRSETFQKVVCGVIPLIVHCHLNKFSRKFWKNLYFMKIWSFSAEFFNSKWLNFPTVSIFLSFGVHFRLFCVCLLSCIIIVVAQCAPKSWKLKPCIFHTKLISNARRPYSVLRLTSVIFTSSREILVHICPKFHIYTKYSWFEVKGPLKQANF